MGVPSKASSPEKDWKIQQERTDEGARAANEEKRIHVTDIGL